MTQNITRIATNSDLPEVLKMIHALAGYHGDEASVTLDDLHRDSGGDAPWVTVLVAEEKDALLGYAALCPLAQLQYGARGMDMHHLFVHPDARGRGVGRRLIDASIAHARRLDCRFVMVGTHPDNTSAQQVYLAAGFDTAGAGGPRFKMLLD